jgi:hypothetical protein
VQVKSFGYPTGVIDRTHFHLISPYEKDASKWLNAKWVDQYTGNEYRIATEGHYGSRTTARVKTYNEVLIAYEFHPDSKCAHANGNVCNRQTVGLLQRRHVLIDGTTYIGKESNRLEDVASRMIQDEDEVYKEYPDRRRDDFTTKVLPVLQAMELCELIRLVPQISRRALINIRAGRSRPHPRNQNMLTELVNKPGKGEFSA